jgi:hypothetical protein
MFDLLASVQVQPNQGSSWGQPPVPSSPSVAVPARRGLLVWLACATWSGTVLAEPPLPIKSGDYTFQHRDAEFPDAPGFPVKVLIRGRRITVFNPQARNQIPAGVIDRATLMWHAATGQWILGYRAADREAPEVGGCSDGPNVIDFAARVIWTCEGGP